MTTLSEYPNEETPYWAVAIWYRCKICKLCFQFEQQLINHKAKTNHYLPNQEALLTNPPLTTTTAINRKVRKAKKVTLPPRPETIIVDSTEPEDNDDNIDEDSTLHTRTETETTVGSTELKTDDNVDDSITTTTEDEIPDFNYNDVSSSADLDFETTNSSSPHGSELSEYVTTTIQHEISTVEDEDFRIIDSVSGPEIENLPISDNDGVEEGECSSSAQSADELLEESNLQDENYFSESFAPQILDNSDDSNFSAQYMPHTPPPHDQELENITNEEETFAQTISESPEEMLITITDTASDDEPEPVGLVGGGHIKMMDSGDNVELTIRVQGRETNPVKTEAGDAEVPIPNEMLFSPDVKFIVSETASEEDINIKLIQEMPEEEQIILCEECGKRFKSNAGLASHRNAFHNHFDNDAKYSCPFCRREFNSHRQKLNHTSNCQKPFNVRRRKRNSSQSQTIKNSLPKSINQNQKKQVSVSAEEPSTFVTVLERPPKRTLATSQSSTAKFPAIKTTEKQVTGLETARKILSRNKGRSKPVTSETVVAATSSKAPSGQTGIRQKSQKSVKESEKITSHFPTVKKITRQSAATDATIKRITSDNNKPDKCQTNSGKKLNLKLVPVNQRRLRVRKRITTNALRRTKAKSTSTLEVPKKCKRRKPFVCKKCNSSFISKTGWTNHLISKHSVIRNYCTN